MKLLMTPLKLHLAIDRTLFFFFFSSIACLFMGKVINIKLGLEDGPIKQDVSLSIHLTRAHRNSPPSYWLRHGWLLKVPPLLAFIGWFLLRSSQRNFELTVIGHTGLLCQGSFTSKKRIFGGVGSQ